MTKLTGTAPIDPSGPAGLMPRDPAVIAKWLLIAFAAGELALNVWKADALEVVFLSFALVPWIVGPAALATLLVARARSRREAWLFLCAEVAAVASTAWLWVLLIFVKTGHANSEYAVGILLLPVAQFAALLVYSVGVIAMADFVVAKDRQQEKPRTILLTILSIACLVLLIVLAWAFGYIRA